MALPGAVYACPMMQPYAPAYAACPRQIMPGQAPMAMYPPNALYPMAQAVYAYGQPVCYYPFACPQPMAQATLVPYPAAYAQPAASVALPAAVPMMEQAPPSAMPGSAQAMPAATRAAAPTPRQPAPTEAHAKAPAPPPAQSARPDREPHYNPQDTEFWTPENDTSPPPTGEPAPPLPQADPEPDEDLEDPAWAEEPIDRPSVGLSLLNGALALGGIGAVGFLLYQLGILPKFF